MTTLALCLLAGCGKSLTDLGEFPCARDGTCPVGYVCSAGTCREAAACGLAGSCPAGLVCLSGEACVGSQTCSVTAQNCADSSRPKCSMTVSSETEVLAQCVPKEGSVVEGAACAINTAVPNSSGRDTCDKGLYCTALYSSVKAPTATGLTCQRLCDASRGCTEGLCAGLTDSVGVCASTCTLGGACTSGRDCKWAEDVSNGSYRGTCMKTGTKGGTDPREAACVGASDCASGYGCWNWGSSSAFCHKLCDASHPCPSGDPCNPDERLPSGSGVCGCELFGTGCGPGRSCILWGDASKALYTACGNDGPRGLGETCGGTLGYCQHGLECWTQDFKTSYCRALCDETHACPGGFTCKAMSFLFKSAGVCLP